MKNTQKTPNPAQADAPRLLPNYCEFCSDLMLGYALDFGPEDGDVIEKIGKPAWDVFVKACRPLDFLTAKCWAGLGPDPLAVIDNAHKVALETRKLYVEKGGCKETYGDPGLPINTVIDGIIDIRSVFLTGKPTSGWLEKDQFEGYKIPYGDLSNVANKQGLLLTEYANSADYKP